MAHPALDFLTLLDPSPDARFNVETLTDVAKGETRPSPDPLQQRFPNFSAKAVEGLLPRLTEINRQGAAVYIAVNRFNGQRKIENLERVRGVHADLDGVTPEQLEVLRNMLEPTIAVQSSNADKQHWYWLLSEGEELAAELAKAVNQGLVSVGADKAAVDVARILRLPGFHHMKSFKRG